MQALVGLWQIFCRQGIDSACRGGHDALAADLNRSLKMKNERDIFDGGRDGRKDCCWRRPNRPPESRAQDRMLDLLAGAAPNDNSDAHTQLVEDMIRIFEAQRLVSLSTTVRTGGSS